MYYHVTYTTSALQKGIRGNTKEFYIILPENMKAWALYNAVRSHASVAICEDPTQ